MFLGTSAPAAATIGVPAPTSSWDDDASNTNSTAPTIPDTPAPTTDQSVSDAAPTNDPDDDDFAGSSRAPEASVDDDSAGSTPSSSSDDSRSSITMTPSPSDLSGAGGDEELENNEAALANGSVGTGSGIAMGMMAVACALCILASVAI